MFENSDNQGQMAPVDLSNEGLAKQAQGEMAGETGQANPTLTADEGIDKQQQAPLQEEKGQGLIAGKFKSVDDLKASHAELLKQLSVAELLGLEVNQELFKPPASEQELVDLYKQAEREFHRLRPEIKKLEQQLSQQEQQQNQQDQLTPEQLNQLVMEAFQENPLATINLLVESMLQERLQPLYMDYQQRVAENQINEMMQKYPDFKDYAEDIMQVFDAQPEIANFDNALELAYFIAKGRNSNRILEQGKKQAYQSIQEKQKAAVEGSNVGKAEMSKSPEDIIVEQILGGKAGGIFG